MLIWTDLRNVRVVCTP